MEVSALLRYRVSIGQTQLLSIGGVLPGEIGFDQHGTNPREVNC